MSRLSCQRGKVKCDNYLRRNMGQSKWSWDKTTLDIVWPLWKTHSGYVSWLAWISSVAGLNATISLTQQLTQWWRINFMILEAKDLPGWQQNKILSILSFQRILNNTSGSECILGNPDVAGGKFSAFLM